MKESKIELIYQATLPELLDFSFCLLNELQLRKLADVSSVVWTAHAQLTRRVPASCITINALIISYYHN